MFRNEKNGEKMFTGISLTKCCVLILSLFLDSIIGGLDTNEIITISKDPIAKNHSSKEQIGPDFSPSSLPLATAGSNSEVCMK